MFVFIVVLTFLNKEALSASITSPPLPTPRQSEWMDREISLMISYDLITQLTNVSNPQHFCLDAGGDVGFPVPSPTLFNPSNTTFTDSWMAAAKAVGAKYTLMVASHCSGFLQWQSKVKLPNGNPYPYTVAQSNWKGGNGDLVDDYVASSRKANLPFGFYLTWNYNYLFNAECCNRVNPANPALGQINVSLSQYQAMMTATMKEIWSRYPNEIEEIWFDGGENNLVLNNLIQKLQPNAIVLDGSGAQIKNYARIIGYESGYSGYPVWSTDTAPSQDGGGDPNGSYFVPPEADTPISQNDMWFWKPGMKYRSLQEMQSVYVNTVGRNSLLEIGVLPDNTGSIPQEQMTLLQALGDYIHTCHTTEAAIGTVVNVTTSKDVTLSFPPSTIVNRIMLQEDVAQCGQRVRGFTVSVVPTGGYMPQPMMVASGTSVGRKLIWYFESGAVSVSSVTVSVTSLGYNDSNVCWRFIGVYSPCPGDALS
eukprot:PhF_6_TR4543/c0_g1_i2/m.6399